MDVLVYTADEAARVLRVRPEKIFEMLSSGEIPAYREGRGWKIPKTLLQATIESKAINEAKERKRIYEENKMEPEKV